MQKLPYTKTLQKTQKTCECCLFDVVMSHGVLGNPQFKGTSDPIEHIRPLLFYYMICSTYGNNSGVGVSCIAIKGTSSSISAKVTL